MEPDKCKTWSWHSFVDLRRLDDALLFLPLKNLLAQRPGVCEAMEKEEWALHAPVLSYVDVTDVSGPR